MARQGLLQHRRKSAGRIAVAAAMLLGAHSAGFAQSAAPATPAVQTAPLKVTVNHAEALTLRANAAVALIANPDIADLINERNNLIFVLGRKPGVTNLLVYDDAGRRLLGRDIEVVPEQGGMVAITRETDVTDYYCEPQCVFYEHEQGGSLPTPPPTAAAAGAGAPPSGQGAPQQQPAGGAQPAAPYAKPPNG
ncbi:MAG TPA: pilus assembly protein N-terminal domain-containing protein [Stellaceae bacterium]|nr:pilus assembly protein N-terminal domain-containing protein [Stellaceae bacterium]